MWRSAHCVWAASVRAHFGGPASARARRRPPSRRIVPKEATAAERRSRADPVEEGRGHAGVLSVHRDARWKLGNAAVGGCHVGAGATCARPIARARGRREAHPGGAHVHATVEQRLLRTPVSRVSATPCMRAGVCQHQVRYVKRGRSPFFISSSSGPPARARARARPRRRHPIARSVNHVFDTGCTPGRRPTFKNLAASGRCGARARAPPRERGRHHGPAAPAAGAQHPPRGHGAALAAGAVPAGRRHAVAGHRRAAGARRVLDRHPGWPRQHRARASGTLGGGAAGARASATGGGGLAQPLC